MEYFPTALSQFLSTIWHLRVGVCVHCTTNTVFSGDDVLITSTWGAMGQLMGYFNDFLNPTTTSSNLKAESVEFGSGSLITGDEITELVTKLLVGGDSPGVS